jgi:hypothetical protein
MAVGVFMLIAGGSFMWAIAVGKNKKTGLSKAIKAGKNIQTTLSNIQRESES